MARRPLPINSDPFISSSSSGVKAVDPRQKIPRYPMQVVIEGSSAWDYGGLGNRMIFPPPDEAVHAWRIGWVPETTSRAMLAHHKVYQGINALKNAAIGDGGRWVPSINPYGPDKSYFKEAWDYAKFMEHNTRRMRGPSNWNIGRNMLDAPATGNKVAAKVWREEKNSRNYRGKWVLDTLQPLPNHSYSFHLDDYGECNEIRVPGSNINNGRLPRDKFFVMSYRPIDLNPYGSKVLWAVYRAVYADLHTDAEESSYMATFSRPSIIIFAAPPPEFTTEDPIALEWRDGSPVMEPDPDHPGEMRQRYGYQVEQNQILFTDFAAGSVWSMEAGTLVQVVEAKEGGSDLFANRRQENARNIMAVILGTHQITESERVISQGNAETGESVAGLNITEMKVMMEQAEQDDLARPTIELNYGPGALDLLPERDYGSASGGRQPRILNSLVGYASNGAMTRAQYWDFCKDNYLPLPFPDDEPLIVPVKTELKKTGGGDKTEPEDA